MYHEITSPPAGALYPELYVSLASFRAQVAWLARHGYHAVTLRRVYDYWMLGRALPPRAIVFSFDDGYASHVDVALPTLRAELGWSPQPSHRESDTGARVGTD